MLKNEDINNYFRFNCSPEGVLHEIIDDPGNFLSTIHMGASVKIIISPVDIARFYDFISRVQINGYDFVAKVHINNGNGSYSFSLMGMLQREVIYISAIQVPEYLFFVYEDMMKIINDQGRMLRTAQKKSSHHEITNDTKKILDDYSQLNNELVSMQRELAIKNHELTDAYKNIEKLSLTDPLTGAGNRRHFMETISAEMDRSARYGQPLSLIMFDIDFFKKVNDTYGHLGGDVVLQEFTSCCMTTMRNSDGFFRVGGEEFAALLVNTDIDSARFLADRIRCRVEGLELEFENQNIQITTSAGVAELLATEGGDSFMHRADSALYRAKQSGRNKVVCCAPFYAIKEK